MGGRRYENENTTTTTFQVAWTDARRAKLRPWIRSAEVRGGGGGVVMRMGTQQRFKWHGRTHGAPYCGHGYDTFR